MEFLQTASDMKGRLNKYKLPLTDSIMAVHEAIVNSIQANANRIQLEIIRDDNDLMLSEIKNNKKIRQIIITDDGDGFTDENFNSFTKIDSTYKIDKGGKGIGRLAWLKVFNKVNIISTFRFKSEICKREIVFSTEENKEIGVEKSVTTDSKRIETRIILSTIKENYYPGIPKTAETYARKILNHCLIYFMKNADFDVLVIDGEERLSVRKIYDDEIKGKKKKLELKIENNGSVYNFILNYLRLEGKGIKDKKHKLKFTANDREVQEVDLRKYNPLFEDAFDDEYILAYIEGEYLDENVSDDRTNFQFGSGDLFLNTQKITIKVAEELKDIYTDDIKKVKEKNAETINAFLVKSPEYRYIYNLDSSIIERINNHTSKEKIEDIFFDQARSMRKEVSKKIKEFDFTKDYKSELELISQKVNSLNQYELSQYVLHRKVILEVLDKLISKKTQEEEYCLEEDLHKLIFPMRTNGNTIDYDDHNLWLIDDRLAYYNFLASDLPFSKYTEDRENKKRVDLAIFRSAFSNKSEKEMQSNITIVEFKKPDRTSDLKYTTLKDQVMGYRDKFLETQVKSSGNGRLIQTKLGGTKFHIYIICELTKKLKEELEDENYEMTLDGMGYRRYYPKKSTMVEVISFEKMAKDAEERNKVFFKKLGIES